MRFFLTLLAALLFFAEQPTRAGALPQRIEKSVAPGQTITLVSLRQYQTARGCTATPEGMINGDPKPRFGTLLSSSKPIVSDGPCGKMEYPVQTISYQAGPASGVDEFDLYIFPSAFWGGSPWSIKVRIAVGGRGASAVQTQSRPVQNGLRSSSEPGKSSTSTASVPAKPVSAELPEVRREISVLSSETVRAGFTYHLKNDCSSDGKIILRLLRPPKTGTVRFVEEKGFPNYRKDDRRFACNTVPSDVTRIYYDAPRNTGRDAFVAEAFYANGNMRRYVIDVVIK
jgi:hypothetical protein